MSEQDAQRDDRDERTEDGRIWRRCSDCAVPFYIPKAVQQKYSSRGLVDGVLLELPRRCFDCRQKRKLAREQQQGDD
jgi:hypothetical protein